MDRFAAFFVALSSLGLGACSPELGDAPFRCNGGKPACPDGYTCNAAQICVREGQCPAGVVGCTEPLPEEAICGDGECHEALGESCESCTKDCGLCPDRCGDGRCNVMVSEDCSSCAIDCGSCDPRCGNGICDGAAGEDCQSCGQDCGACSADCGDGACQDFETCTTCPGDCGICPTLCGDKRCDDARGESCTNCVEDCGSCATVCGDGRCDYGAETCSSCPSDCGVCPPCTPGETRCANTATWEECSAGTWVSSSCESICQGRGDDYGVCTGSSCKCGDEADFGEICNAFVACKPDLVCATYDGKNDGFCTSVCTNIGYTCAGGGWGEWPECSSKLVGGENVCLFWCDDQRICPGDMVCPNPYAGSYCEPRD